MTPLGALLVQQIQASGPISVADYMAACLMHPEYGYYATRDPLGAAGDFTTAPEISQMFGELLGLSLAQSWLDQGAPTPFALTELGPGRGTLMKDVLRATRAVPGFHDGMQLHLVEASPTLRAVQAETLGRDDITWHGTVDGLPDLPLFLVANEFFDALPVRQFQRDGDAWRERVVGLSGAAMQMGLGGPMAAPQLAHRQEDTQDSDIVEICAAGEGVAQQIGAQIARRGGTAIVVDYGDWRSLGDTLQAVRGHEHADPLAEPGLADLTTHVDFEALTRAAPCRFSRVTPQGVFLERLGITARAQALAKGMADDTLDAHIAAHRRLTHPAEMGTLFKVLALYPDGAAPPPGLDP